MHFNQEDEERLAGLLQALRSDFELNVKFAEEYTIVDVFWLAKRLRDVVKSNKKFQEDRTEDLHIIDEAKLRIMNELRVSESNAHAFIFKEAMDARMSKVEFAKKLLSLESLK